jgi:hypothetical protein
MIALIVAVSFLVEKQSREKAWLVRFGVWDLTNDLYSVQHQLTKLVIYNGQMDDAAGLPPG